MAGKIIIGTSGYIFPDWKPRFYPSNLPQKDFLKFYSQHFNSVELNFSYYAMPKQENLVKLESQVPNDFTFFIKAYKTMTHYILEKKRFKDVKEDFELFLISLIGTKKIIGILFQFPYSFKFNKNNLSDLFEIVKLVKSKGLEIIIEFRHKSWLNYSVSDMLKEENAVYCNVDEPNLPGLIPPIVRSFGKMSYVRFHGRNAEMWWNKDKLAAKLRYDYLYDEDELLEWVKKMEYLTSESEMVYVFFNNCHLGKAVRNARQMQELVKEL